MITLEVILLRQTIIESFIAYFQSRIEAAISILAELGSVECQKMVRVVVWYFKALGLKLGTWMSA